MSPAASPSSPSTKFTAFITTTTTSTVTMSESRGEPIVRPPMGNVTSCTPCQAMKSAASTCPASLVIQSRSQMSSATPSRHTITAPPTMAQACWSVAKTPLRKGIWDANVTATTSPAVIASPPRRAVGTVCTSRSRTAVMAPVLAATQWARGVRR